MKTAIKLAAQGDVIFRRVDKIPPKATEVPRKGPIVVAHSETGHHHAINDRGVTMFEEPGSALVCYLRMDTGLDANVGGVDVVHNRPFDTHETIRLLGKPGDIWEVRRQREHTPEGWKRVLD